MPKPARHRAITVVVTCAMLCLVGCQHYERQPLDLDARRAALDQRVLDGSRVEDFLGRLRALGHAVPDEFSFDDGLTPSEGEVVALFYNAELRHARLAAGVALAHFENAGLWDDPEFGFDGAEILSSSSPFEFGLILSLTIPVSGRLEVEKARAGTAYEAELRRIVGAEWMTRHEVRRRWAMWTVAEERADLLREVIAQEERVGAMTDRLETVGELSRVEGRLFRVELAGRRADLSEAEFRAQRARFDLLGLMGLTADAGVDLRPAWPASVSPGVEDPIRRLIAANPELAVARAEYQTAEESLRLEIRKQFPDITIGSGYGSEDDDRLLLGVSVPIPILNANRAGIAEARASREVARAVAETTFERLARELRTAEARLDAARAQRARYESEIVPMLAEQSAEIERIAELGEVNALLLLETLTRQFDAKSRLLELRLDELDAAIAITQLLGPDAAADPAPFETALNSDRLEHQSADVTAPGDEQ